MASRELISSTTSRGLTMFTSYDQAVHSDFLICWTGKDIDAAHDPNWYDDHHLSKTSSTVDGLYLRRLCDILTYGLWMTEEAPQKFRVGLADVTIPATPRCCFTELKLSESRRHAARYGRLGVGVKRPFLFRRYGRPLAYFGFGEQSNDDKFLEACCRDIGDKTLLNFFKPMNKDSKKLTYELYAESEWRILYFDELLSERRIVDPRNSANPTSNLWGNELRPVAKSTCVLTTPACPPACVALQARAVAHQREVAA